MQNSAPDFRNQINPIHKACISCDLGDGVMSRRREERGLSGALYYFSWTLNCSLYSFLQMIPQDFVNDS